LTEIYLKSKTQVDDYFNEMIKDIKSLKKPKK